MDVYLPETTFQPPSAPLPARTASSLVNVPTGTLPPAEAPLARQSSPMGTEKQSRGGIQTFQETVWGYYAKYGRHLPWREPDVAGELSPYKILVSEIMLQQTQVPRVVPKYHAFLKQFPDSASLASAPLSAVLAEWSGLGYNRRAKYLHEAIKHLIGHPVRWTVEVLTACKGIGPNTAAAVVTYAYNQPLVFIETNIRTVFIHHFFSDQADIHDKQLMPLIEQALDQEHPREWYWALMDYGTYLKAHAGNASRSSRHYAKQSRFQGSKRQIRGQVLKLLKDREYRFEELPELFKDDRIDAVLTDLLNEGLITRHRDQLRLG